jgi:hypothetical protein
MHVWNAGMCLDGQVHDRRAFLQEPERGLCVGAVQHQDPCKLVPVALYYIVTFHNVNLCRFMTDGALLSEMTGDPLLERYSVVILDEVHTRAVATDVLLALIKGVRMSYITSVHCAL